jgi:hypothetical protein
MNEAHEVVIERMEARTGAFVDAQTLYACSEDDACKVTGSGE